MSKFIPTELVQIMPTLLQITMENKLITIITLQDILGLLHIANLCNLYGNILELAREYHCPVASIIVFDKNFQLLNKSILVMKNQTAVRREVGNMTVTVSKMNNNEY